MAVIGKKLSEPQVCVCVFVSVIDYDRQRQ